MKIDLKSINYKRYEIKKEAKLKLSCRFYII